MVLPRSIATIGGLTSIRRVLGFVRDILIASALGAGPIADAFFVAFKFPNLFRRLFAEGAFTAAFVPIFAGVLETEGRDQARAFAEQSLSVLTQNTAGGADGVSALTFGTIEGQKISRPRYWDDDDKVEICHVPPGNESRKHTIEVDESAVRAHLSHGDYFGECDDDD